MVFFCILDFEATCWEGSINKDVTEIIEFPSVLYKMDHRENVSLIGEFHEYCRPEIHPKLTEFCTALTGIEQKTVDSADIFENVFDRHQSWLREHCSDERVIIATCGAWDLKTMLPREVKNKGVSKVPHHYRHFLKPFFSSKKKKMVTCAGSRSCVECKRAF